MIPARIEDDEASSGERRVFGLLAEDDPETKDWTVLHSLGLARRATGPYGEIDFVVIAPGKGIVCLEVKGGRLSCEAGVWRTTDRHGNEAKLRKSPFMQARESMFALRDAIIREFGKDAPESRCPIGCAVVFPDVTCPPRTPETDRSDAIDLDDLRKPISESVLRIARDRLRGFQPRVGDPLPTASEAKAIKGFLRPDFDLIVAKGVSVGRSEERILRLTEEQYTRLDELEANPRCLFEGAAGTGKTLLALEFARRASRDGSKVALLCYNRLLGDWLKERAAETDVTADTWHEIVRGFIARSSVADEFRKEEEVLDGDDADGKARFFAETYPLHGQIAFEELGPQFDVLVMDEAQDLLEPHKLGVLNRAVRGGLAEGRWAFFGDFARQALYGGEADPDAALSARGGHFARARLTLNCRNTRPIAEATARAAGFEEAPSRPGAETGLPVERLHWKTPADLAESLTGAVERLVKDGMPIEDVTVLSPRRMENSSLAGIERISRFPLADVSRGMDDAPGALKFSTIHAFKGLESPAVIVIDVDEADSVWRRSLLYVAMSRARSLLILMIPEDARDWFDRRIGAGKEKERRR